MFEIWNLRFEIGIQFMVWGLLFMKVLNDCPPVLYGRRYILKKIGKYQ